MNVIHKVKTHTKSNSIFHDMQKNPAENFSPIEVDPITGNFMIDLPEWMVNDMGWYEGTVLQLELSDEDEIILKEKEDD